VLTALLVEKLTPIAAETQRLLRDPDVIEATLRDGARRAAAIADPIVAKTEELVGFLRL
jgi:tryptophanyl-tRNA synthetase